MKLDAKDNLRRLIAGGAGATLLAVAGLACTGCGPRSRAPGVDETGVNVGLAGLMSEEAGAADPGLVGAEPEAAPGSDPADLKSFVAEQTAALERAMSGAARAEPEAEPESAAPETEPAADVSLAALAGEGLEQGDEPEADPNPPTTPEPEVVASPVGVDELYGQLTQALGQELETTSEPFRTAVALIALAAAQGRDPMEAIRPGSAAGSRLSSTERESAEAVAGLLETLLSPGESEASDRATALRQLSQQLIAEIGFRIPRAALCTRVQGFGKYEPFTKTDFLAGRPIRALVYAEVDGFEHRPVDTTRLGGLVPEDQWSVELSEELKLYHVADARLAWRRPAEKIVETSRNRQRDFYLLAEVELPRTLTVGSYELKVIITDDVSGAVAEQTIPIGVVADPGLAWQPE